MKLTPLFSIGDLVRRRSILANKNQGYGIVIDIMPEQIRCIWSDGKEVWISVPQIYLIARGQNGEKS